MYRDVHALGNQFLKLFISSYSTYSYSPIPHPKNGLNSGVMLMNLEHMRNQNLNLKMLIIFEELQSYMAFCDQVSS